MKKQVAKMSEREKNNIGTAADTLWSLSSYEENERLCAKDTDLCGTKS